MEYREILEKIANLELDESSINLGFLTENYINDLLEEDYMNIRLLREPESNKPLTSLIKTNPKFKMIWDVWNCGNKIRKIPEEQRIYKICKLAIECGNENEDVIKYIPKNFMDENFRLLALKNGFKYEDVRPDNASKDFCLEALKYDHETLKFMPKSYLDYEVYRTAVSTSMYAMQYIPKEIINDELCDLAISKHGIGLSLIPEEFRTLERCMISLKKDGRVIKYVPREVLTKLDISAIIKSCASAIEYVEPEFLTYKACQNAVSANSCFFRFVPEKFKDEQMYLSMSIGLGSFSPNWDYNFVQFFKNIPNKYKTLDFYKKCISLNGEIIGYKPEYIKDIVLDRDIYLEAIKCCGSALRFVPIRYIDYEMVKFAVTTKIKKDYKYPLAVLGDMLKTYPKEMTPLVNAEIYELAIKKSPVSLRYVPEEFKTIEMCQKAYSRTKNIKKFIPKEFHDKLELLPIMDNKENKLKKLEYNKFLESRIFEILTNNPNTTIKQIMSQLGENENKITTIIRKLRKDGKVLSFIQESPVQESIKNALQEKPLTKIELVKITGRTYKSIETALTTMKKNNLVLNKNGIWFLL